MASLCGVALHACAALRTWLARLILRNRVTKRTEMQGASNYKQQTRDNSSTHIKCRKINSAEDSRADSAREKARRALKSMSYQRCMLAKDFSSVTLYAKTMPATPRQKDGLNEWNAGAAVSQICTLHRAPPISTLRILKSTGKVGKVGMESIELVDEAKRCIKSDVPAHASPTTISFMR